MKELLLTLLVLVPLNLMSQSLLIYDADALKPVFGAHILDTKGQIINISDKHGRVSLKGEIETIQVAHFLYHEKDIALSSIQHLDTVWIKTKEYLLSPVSVKPNKPEEYFGKMLKTPEYKDDFIKYKLSFGGQIPLPGVQSRFEMELMNKSDTIDVLAFREDLYINPFLCDANQRSTYNDAHLMSALAGLERLKNVNKLGYYHNRITAFEYQDYDIVYSDGYIYIHLYSPKVDGITTINQSVMSIQLDSVSCALIDFMERSYGHRGQMLGGTRASFIQIKGQTIVSSHTKFLIDQPSYQYIYQGHKGLHRPSARNHRSDIQELFSRKHSGFEREVILDSSSISKLLLKSQEHYRKSIAYQIFVSSKENSADYYIYHTKKNGSHQNLLLNKKKEHRFYWNNEYFIDLESRKKKGVRYNNYDFFHYKISELNNILFHPAYYNDRFFDFIGENCESFSMRDTTISDIPSFACQIKLKNSPLHNHIYGIGSSGTEATLFLRKQDSLLIGVKYQYNQDHIFQYIKEIPSGFEPSIKDKYKVASPKGSLRRLIKKNPFSEEQSADAPQKKLETTLEGVSGKYILIDFWFLNCAFCIKSFPMIKELGVKYRDKMDIVLVNPIDYDEYQIRDFLELKGLAFPSFTEISSVLKGFEPNAYPTYILLGKDGQVLQIQEGYEPKALERMVRKHVK